MGEKEEISKRWKKKRTQNALTKEADIIQSGSSIKELQRNFPRYLIRTRESNNRKNTFNKLTMHGGTQGDPWTKHQDIHSQSTVAESVLYMKNEVPS
jgi:hypothetical protein